MRPGHRSRRSGLRGTQTRAAFRQPGPGSRYTSVSTSLGLQLHALMSGQITVSNSHTEMYTKVDLQINYLYVIVDGVNKLLFTCIYGLSLKVHDVFVSTRSYISNA